MKYIVSLLATAAFFLLTSVGSQAKALPKAIDFQGAITAITETSITVQSPKGTRSFAVYPGTVFGQGAKAKITDFKPGDNVVVIFSEAAGQLKAENIRKPADDRKKPAAKPKPKAKAPKKAK
jgi:Cu/Ag efflux protein CusF